MMLCTGQVITSSPYIKCANFCWWLLCTITIVYLQELLHYNTRIKNLPKAPLTNFKVNLEEISGPVIKLCSTFLEQCSKLSSAIWCTTSQADTTARQQVLFYFNITLWSIRIIENFKLWCSSFFRSTHV